MKPTTKQLEYLSSIVDQLGEWRDEPPKTLSEASEQIDKAKRLWAIEHSGDEAEIY